MKALGTHLLVLLAILLTVSTVTAEEIGFLTVKNSVQAEVAEGIVVYAFTRVENRFLVAVDAQQKELLAKSGMEFESIIADGDPASTYIIRQLDRNIYDQATLSKLTGSFDLGAGMKLTEFTSVAASALAESPGLAVNALTEKKIHFRYVPTQTTSMLAMVDDFPT
ncbi:MAG: hypothetical protein KAU36_04390, partial [candidate division Zixibacteria bacterium]|nr:hypothetical protein [candidate division Zixibacteria bacterium]